MFFFLLSLCRTFSHAVLFAGKVEKLGEAVQKLREDYSSQCAGASPARENTKRGEDEKHPSASLAGLSPPPPPPPTPVGQGESASRMACSTPQMSLGHYSEEPSASCSCRAAALSLVAPVLTGSIHTVFTSISDSVRRCVSAGSGWISARGATAGGHTNTKKYSNKGFKFLTTVDAAIY